MTSEPFVTVIVPVYNAERTLHQCLKALQASTYDRYEVLVVDDASTDNSRRIARERGVTVLSIFERDTPGGPAVGRNLAAIDAKGDVLLFVDADVRVYPDTVAHAASLFARDPGLAAAFGSYDTRPSQPNFISQYRNLLHHFVHQTSDPSAKTFWAGCGAIRRDIFVEARGFDLDRYSRPSIEDIELGLRLSNQGYRIVLDRDLQVTHLKEWRLGSMVRTDVLSRAVPWSQLILETGKMAADLNLQIQHRISGAFALLAVALLGAAAFVPVLGLVAAGLLVSIFGLNHRLFRFFLRERGVRFMLLAFATHILYFLYGTVTFGVCWLRRRADILGATLTAHAERRATKAGVAE